MRNEDRLLDEVLRTPEYEEFQRRVEAEMLREVRRQQRRRAPGKWLGIAACAPLLLCGLLWFAAPEQAPRATSAFSVVSSEPLPQGMIVGTTGSVQVVETQPDAELAIPGTREIQLVSDAEMLALFRGEPVVLVRSGMQVKVVFPKQDSSGAELF